MFRNYLHFPKLLFATFSKLTNFLWPKLLIKFSLMISGVESSVKKVRGV